MNSNAITKIEMFNGSLRCFICGLLGLLPVIGLPFAITALWVSGGVRVQEKACWNIARPYRIWGVVFAAAGTIVWLLIAVLIIYNTVTNNSGSGGTYYMSGDGGE